MILISCALDGNEIDLYLFLLIRHAKVIPFFSSAKEIFIKYIQMKNPALLLLALMVLIAGLGFGVYAYWGSVIGLVLLFVGVMAGGTVLIFKKEINLYIHKRTGRLLSEKEIGYLAENFPLLKYISAEKKPHFYQKVNFFRLDKEIISQDPKERVYHPAVLLCGAYAAYFDMKNLRKTVPFPAIPVYVFYGHAFPSPQFPKALHISEYFEEDGALLFSVPHMMKGNEDPSRFLNIVLYESARVAMNGLFDSVDFPTLRKLCTYGGYTIAKLEEYLGLSQDNINIKALAVSLFFADRDRFVSAFPRLADLFQRELIYTKEEKTIAVK